MQSVNQFFHTLTLCTMLMDIYTDQIIIPQSKTKVILLTLGAILFVFLGYWLWSTADNQTRYDPPIVKLMAINSFIFFGLCGLFGFRKLFDRKPGLIIDQHGITNNSTATGEETIVWDDITELSIQEIKRTKFILVFVKNPKDYINKANIFKKFWMNINYHVYGTPISITSTTLQCNITDLEKTLKEQRKKHCA